MTYGTPTWIWSVAFDDALCVRAYNGKKAAVRQRAGRIIAADMTKEVTFEPVEGRSTTASTTPIGPSTVAVRTCAL